MKPYEGFMGGVFYWHDRQWDINNNPTVKKWRTTYF